MNLLFTSYLHVVIMRGFTSWQNSAPDKNSTFWVVSEHLTLSITQIHTGAFAKYVSRISDGAPWFPGALSGRLPHLLVKSALQIHVKKPIHRGSASSQGKRKNTYQLWKIMNIRCSGYINSAEFLNGCIWQDDNSSTVQIMVIFVS